MNEIDFAHQLFDAARNGETEFVVSAVDQGVPVNLTDPKGNTLLMLAAYYGHAPLTAALIERGADLDRMNDRQQTPVAGAVFKKHTDVIRVLIAHGADLDAGIPTARAAAQMFGVDLTVLEG
ncbi:MAG: ankyrin repeat domain-containing protein [Leucobacter sp.]|jgi:ankyrin repeat protein|nr:ankyrin repeat domain-containing protein [Leucobacter sp.]